MEEKQITLQIDGHFITVPEGSTILEAAIKIGININIIAPLYPFPKTMTIRKPKIKRTPVMAKTLIILFILDIRGSFRHF